MENLRRPAAPRGHDDKYQRSSREDVLYQRSSQSQPSRGDEYNKRASREDARYRSRSPSPLRDYLHQQRSSSSRDVKPRQYSPSPPIRDDSKHYQRPALVDERRFRESPPPARDTGYRRPSAPRSPARDDAAYMQWSADLREEARFRHRSSSPPLQGDVRQRRRSPTRSPVRNDAAYYQLTSVSRQADDRLQLPSRVDAAYNPRPYSPAFDESDRNPYSRTRYNVDDVQIVPIKRERSRTFSPADSRNQSRSPSGVLFLFGARSIYDSLSFNLGVVLRLF
jgi:hypothetical protein